MGQTDQTTGCSIVALETLAHGVLGPVMHAAAGLIKDCVVVVPSELARQEPECYRYLASLLRNLKPLTGDTVPRVVLCHGWMDVPSHPCLLRLYRDLEAALVARAGPVTSHVFVYLQRPVHECFESMVTSDPIGSKSVTASSISDARIQLENSIVAYSKQDIHTARHVIRCPPYLEDNPYDVYRVAHAIADIANHSLT